MRSVLASMVLLAGLASVAIAQPADKPHAGGPPVPFPHPLITEVLYNVPTGPEGDANGDGTRSATGDEFIELINPHDKPINLKGYVLTDGKNFNSPKSKSPNSTTASNDDTDPPATTQEKPSANSPKSKKPSSGSPTPRNTRKAGDDDARIRFVFPEITLAPGEVVVVFNGYKPGAGSGGGGGAGGKAENGDDDGGHDPALNDGETEPPRRIDDGGVDPNRRRPAGNSPKHADAVHVSGKRFSMHASSPYKAFANTGDCVLLTDPTGEPVECISWGERRKPPEDTAPLMERAPECRGSVVRVGMTKSLVSHQDRFGELFSPGTHALKATTPEDK
jgi:hypothetical protein